MELEGPVEALRAGRTQRRCISSVANAHAMLREIRSDVAAASGVEHAQIQHQCCTKRQRRCTQCMLFALTLGSAGVNELAVIGKRVLGAFDDKLIRVWNTDTWQVCSVPPWRRFDASTFDSCSAALEPNHLANFQVVVIGIDKVVWVVQLERTILGHVGAVYALAVDSSRLYTASYDRCIRAWY